MTEMYCVKEKVIMMEYLFEDKDDPIEDGNNLIISFI